MLPGTILCTPSRSDLATLSIAWSEWQGLLPQAEEGALQMFLEPWLWLSGKGGLRTNVTEDLTISWSSLLRLENGGACRGGEGAKISKPLTSPISLCSTPACPRPPSPVQGIPAATPQVAIRGPNMHICGLRRGKDTSPLHHKGRKSEEAFALGRDMSLRALIRPISTSLCGRKDTYPICLQGKWSSQRGHILLRT